MPLTDLITEQYNNNKNYRIIDHTEADNDLCYIYCSDNGLYFKDNEEDFKQRILANDRFQWVNIKAEIIPSREIFIRDIWLSWYVRGINSKICDYEKLISFLADMTKGYRVRCVGVSSGGYIANIIANELEAEISYAFSCQFSLKNHGDHLATNPFLKEYLEKKGDHYFEYYRQLKDSDVRILYVYPDQCEQDIIQHSFVEDCDNVVSFGIHKESHGICIGYYALPKFISLDFRQCFKMRNVHYRNLWTLKLCGIGTVVKLAVKKVLKWH